MEPASKTFYESFCSSVSEFRCSFFRTFSRIRRNRYNDYPKISLSFIHSVNNFDFVLPNHTFKKKKRKLDSFVANPFFLAFLFRSFISEMICTLLGISLVFWVSSDSSGGENSLPPLESSSSSESLNTFRNVYAADYEHTIYNRIRTLENGNFYNIPPQTRPGEYESIVRQHFDQAITVDHLRSAMDMEYNEVLIWEKKALLQDRLFSFMISEENLQRIIELSPYEDIRKEAFEFIEGEVEFLNNLQSPSERGQMNERLSSFLTSIRRHGRASPTYKKLDSHFIDEEFRRQNGLPLP